MPKTDEDAALAAVTALSSPSEELKAAQKKVHEILHGSNDDPFVDIHELFSLYNTLYFKGLLLPRVELTWSPRLTLCAGICELLKDSEGKYRRIRIKLSEPLLKYRLRKDTVNTLLHEAVHAYFLVTTSFHHSRGDDGTGHGAGFLLLADAINSHGGYEVTVYHTFHDEVESYRTHIWQCDGPCKSREPFFGLVKRSMNRAPGKSDTWWERHQQECGGSFTKIAEPEMSKQQVMKLSAMQRAGRQKNKIDGWVKTDSNMEVPPKDAVVVEESAGRDGPRTGSKRARSPLGFEAGGDVKRVLVECPICQIRVDERIINPHLDSEHPP